ncbi:hypothetical protein KR009_003205 [Drosophila setifemur]|nr:hypothetical protein KR009_003205 [Drosophila setifemur]
MERIVTLLAIVVCGLVLVDAQNCQECQEANDVYCYNQTSYQYCMGGATIGSVENCPTGSVCSNSDATCVPSSDIGNGVLDVCGSSSSGQNCAVCAATGSKFTCVSRTQYARCSGGAVVSSNVFTCGADEICNTEALATYKTLCVPSCAASYLDIESTCTNSDYATTTTTADPNVTPSTPSPTTQQTACTAAADSLSIPATRAYFYALYTADTSCNSYLYCQRNAATASSTWTTVFLTCNNAALPYFNSATNKCVATKPSTCN